MRGIRVFFQSFDLILFGTILLLSLAGLVTMYSYQGNNAYFHQQILWISVASCALFLSLLPDYRFFRTWNTTFYFYAAIVASLILVLFIGEITLGAQSRFNFGFF